ncbi:MAG: DUF1566 domain-containing protein [Nitrospinales bacterium]
MDESKSTENQPAPEAKSDPVEKPAKAKAPPAKPAVKPKAAKKPAEPKKPLVDNGDGTITDPNSGLMWKKTETWLDCHKFYLWKDHKEYVDKVNKEKLGGFDDWRIPSKAEALTLFDKTKKCLDKNGSYYNIDPIFEAGGAGNTWISESSDDNITRYDFKTGVETVYPTTDVWASIRLVRKV